MESFELLGQSTHCETYKLADVHRPAINLKFQFFQFIPDFIH